MLGVNLSGGTKVPTLPEYRGRSPEQIISKSERVYFDSVGYTYRALSWLDLSKRERNLCAFQYAAQDARQAIEQLFFEEIVLSVGTELDRKEYEKCKGNGTRLHKIIRRLNLNYKKLAVFTQGLISMDPQSPPIVIWDHKVLIRHWGKISTYLHWAGEPAETLKSSDWVDQGIAVVEAAASYIWEQNRAGYTGIMMPHKMQPEVRESWKRFRDGEIDFDSVKRMADIALPILRKRLKV
jgi:hypothetical protein